MTPTQIAAIKGMLAYFDSGNNIPVDKAVIKANCAEVAALRAALAETAPVQEPVYAFRRKGMDDFCTCNKARFDELASKPHLFETAIFYTSQPRKAVKLSDIA